MIDGASSSEYYRVGQRQAASNRPTVGTELMLHNCRHRSFGYSLAAWQFSTYFCVAYSLPRQCPVRQYAAKVVAKPVLHKF